MKLLFLSDGLPPFVLGGMQQHSLMMVKHLAPLVEEITLLYCGLPNEPPPQASVVLKLLGNPVNVKVIGVEFQDNSFLPGHYVRASIHYSSKLLFAIKESLSSYDLVYAQGFTGYAFLGRHDNLVSNLHGLNMFQKSFSIRELIEKTILRKIARIILLKSSYCISLGGKLTDILLGLGVERIIVSPNGVDDKWIYNSWTKKEGKIRLVFIGRNDTMKGFSILLESLEQSKDRVSLDVIGPWPEIKITPHDLSFYGEIKSKERVFEIIDNADVLVVPSLSEGMPTVILEAMARGKAIIATDVGAVSDLVSDENGVLIEPGSVEAMTHAIEKINTIDLQKASIASIQHVKKFVWQRVVKNLLKEFI